MSWTKGYDAEFDLSEDTGRDGIRIDDPGPGEKDKTDLGEIPTEESG